eukprot:142474_1
MTHQNSTLFNRIQPGPGNYSTRLRRLLKVDSLDYSQDVITYYNIKCRLRRRSRNRRGYSDEGMEKSLNNVKTGLKGVMDGVEPELKDTIAGVKTKLKDVMKDVAGKGPNSVDDIPASSDVTSAPVGGEEDDASAKNLYGDLKKKEHEGDHSDLGDDSTATDSDSGSESASSDDEPKGPKDSGSAASSEESDSDSAYDDSDSKSEYASGDSFSSDDSESMIDWHTNFEVRFNGLEAMKRLMAFLTVIALVVGIFVYWAWIMSMLASVTPSSIFGPEKKAKHIGEMQSLLPTTHVVDTSMAPHGLTPIAKRGAIVFVRQ